MEILILLVFFGIGLGLMIFFAEQLIKGVVGTSIGFGLSTFLLSVIFIGFDPDNLAVGTVASAEGIAGMALGSILGGAMVAIALAFGISALVAPMTFAQVPPQVLAVQMLAVVLLAALALDGQLSRVDGGMLLVAFGLAILYLVRLGRRGLDIQPSGEVGHRLDKGNIPGKWPSLGLFIVSLMAIVVGSEMLVSGAQTLLRRFGVSDLPFGMTILAFLVSIEELERELPAARQGRPEISFGNVLGSILAFFLCNAGIIALVRPVPVDHAVLTFYLPLAVLTTAVVSGVMLTKRVPRWAGSVFILLYAVFVIGAWFMSAHGSCRTYGRDGAIPPNVLYLLVRKEVTPTAPEACDRKKREENQPILAKINLYAALLTQIGPVAASLP
jgi:cation:H+ antiporter